MLPKSELEILAKKSDEKDDWTDWSGLFKQGIADMMADSRLTDEEKHQLLRELKLPDEEWEPIKLPEGAEPVSVTLIKMRCGE